MNLGTLQNSHEGRISCLGLSADGSALCTGSWDSNLKVRELINFYTLTVCVHVCVRAQQSALFIYLCKGQLQFLSFTPISFRSGLLEGIEK